MSRWSGSDEGRCTVTCYKRDDYRYSGHGSSGFTMHYSKERCTRAALPGKEKCWQHDEESTTARYQRAHEKRMRKLQRKQREREAWTAQQVATARAYNKGE